MRPKCSAALEPDTDETLKVPPELAVALVAKVSTKPSSAVPGCAADATFHGSCASAAVDKAVAPTANRAPRSIFISIILPFDMNLRSLAGI